MEILGSFCPSSSSSSSCTSTQPSSDSQTSSFSGSSSGRRWWSFLRILGSTIVQGIGFGTESAVAYRVVDVLMGPRTIQHEIVVSEAAAAALAPISSSMTGSDACSNHSKAFQDCVNHFGSDISKCQFYMDMLSECKKKSASGMLRA
ncbi:hypothetical protein GBA52_027113 [Prunus armeniaca]|nr:hypothetical protein GBA52_027113 [Prunus armeniaca]